jgi:predicted nucleic acid-binding protein
MERHPFSRDSFAIFKLANLKRVSGFLSAASITDIFYLVRKQRRDSEEVYRMMERLTALFSVAPVSETTVATALALRWKDFEDAVQYAAATEIGVDCIVTRNAADYELSGIPCMRPADFIARFNER